jgi:SAM-dependent methyltransferase
MTDAKAYYEQNAQTHGEERATSPVLATGRIPKSPGEVDLAVSWLLRHLHPKPSSRCLDVGCAQLTFLRSVQPLFGERWGIDIAQYGNWRDHPDIHTFVCNLDQAGLPFADRTFDAVVMLMVLEHVFNPFHAVREVRRVCMPDGYSVIAVPNIAGWKHRLALLRGQLPVTATRQSFNREAWDGYHLHYFTQASLEWLLRIVGLRPLAWGASGGLPRLKQLRPDLIGSDIMVLCQPCEPSPGLAPNF